MMDYDHDVIFLYPCSATEKETAPESYCLIPDDLFMSAYSALKDAKSAVKRGYDVHMTIHGSFSDQFAGTVHMMQKNLVIDAQIPDS